MRYTRVSEALKELWQLDGIEELRRAINPKERLELLMKYLPQTCSWPPLPARELIFRLQQDEGIDMAVCSFYSLSDGEEDEQYCLHKGGKVPCLYPQPWQGFCAVRDADNTDNAVFSPNVS